MLKTAIRYTPRQALTQLSSSARPAARRFLSTAPLTARSRGWKSSAARWGAAAGVVYYYNTSNIFAEQPESAISHLEESVHHVQDSKLPTLDAIAEERRHRREELAAEESNLKGSEGEAPLAEEQHAVDGGLEEEEGQVGGIEGLEEEADQQGAFNPETGEINWDCPCLGGMAHGPCGEEFREAFSCFVYSKEEPKGMECIEKFKGMQDCFREHPEMYGSELEDDEEEVEEELRVQAAEKEAASPVQSEAAPIASIAEQATAKLTTEESITVAKSDDKTKKGGDQGSELVPKDAVDAPAQN